jgi:uncharacterized hydrophobic protein (TIGR00271 family)
MIASLGLDLNSPAVIIGAMLISPLMSPILGIGLGVGINDRSTLLISLQHFGVAIAIALVTSYIYFLLTPLGIVTEEILARTKPTILDVLIATFGGFAGIISGSRKDKSNAIPGVAIATALMPPLCVTGFGLAQGEWTIFFNSFYLFFLNSFFVALATFIMVRYLRFPVRKHGQIQERRKTIALMMIFSLIMIIPSFLILRTVISDILDENRSQAFISSLTEDQRKYIDDYQFIPYDSLNVLLLKVYGSAIPDSLIPGFESRLDSLGLTNTRIEIMRTSQIEPSKFRSLEARLSGYENITDQLKTAQESYENLTRTQLQLDSLRQRQRSIPQIFTELKTLVPEVSSISFGTNEMTTGDTTLLLPTLLIHWQEDFSGRAIPAAETKVREFVRVRMDLDTLVCFSYR